MTNIRVLFSTSDIPRLIEEATIQQPPFYTPQGDEVELFERAYKKHHAVALLGPTGSGKSRLVEYMAHKLGRPLYTIPGYESVDAGTVVGSIMATGGESVYVPGKLYKGARIGAFVHLEELLEMNADVLPFLHGVSDWRRRLEVDDISETIIPPEGFMLVTSMNPGAAYQKPGKRFPKPSLIQRFDVIQIGYVRGPVGQDILVKEGGITKEMAALLDKLATKIDNTHASKELAGTLHESIGYHALIKAAQQIHAGTPPLRAVHACISSVLSHDQGTINAIDDIARTIIPTTISR